MKKSHELLEDVIDEVSFLLFVKALIAERKLIEENTPNEVGFTQDWANNSISNFLEGAVAWAEDSDFGIYQDAELANNKWKQFAVFMYCGKIYE